MPGQPMTVVRQQQEPNLQTCALSHTFFDEEGPRVFRPGTNATIDYFALLAAPFYQQKHIYM